MLKDVTIKMYDGTERKFESVSTHVDKELKLYTVEGDACHRFMCHLDDLISVEEKSAVVTDEYEESLVNIICSQGKIPAIKEYRNRTGLMLKESKHYIDDLVAKHKLLYDTNTMQWRKP